MQKEETENPLVATMSIAEFFIENGIVDAEGHDAEGHDAEGYDNALHISTVRDDDDKEEEQEEARPPEYFSGLAVVQQGTATCDPPNRFCKVSGSGSVLLD
jgi:hypothetical protein